MAVMAKPKPVKTEPDDAKKANRTGSPVSVYVDEDIRAAVDAYVDDHNTKNEHHATLRSTIEAALKMYLKAKGFWPPKN